MKKYLLLNILLSLVLPAQNLAIKYRFIVENKTLQKVFNFDANVIYDPSKNTEMYQVQFGLPSNLELPQNAFVSKKKSKYILYKDESKNTLIAENVPNVKEEDYIFEDNYTMQWSLSTEKKKINGVILKKAETNFRGRHYIAWYNPGIAVKMGPWKFTNCPGLLYEVSDETGKYKWELLEISKTREEVVNPFVGYKGKITSFKEYPRIRYGLTPELQKELDKIPGNTVTEQERNGIETKFEWEK